MTTTIRGPISGYAQRHANPVHGVYGSAYVDGLIWASGGGTNIGGNHGSLHNQVFSPSVSCE